MKTTATIYLVDDEPGMLKSLARLLRAEGFDVCCHGSAAEFLASHNAGQSGCLVLDVAMPGIDGLELQKRLEGDKTLLSIVFLTGHGDIPMSVRAMKAGAVDFLTKPVDDTELLRAIRTGLQRSETRKRQAAELRLLRERHTRLTPREQEVMRHVIAGKMNKRIAADLGTGEQNIKIHRGRVMAKLEVESVAELVRAADRLGIHPA